MTLEEEQKLVLCLELGEWMLEEIELDDDAHEKTYDFLDILRQKLEGKYL